MDLPFVPPEFEVPKEFQGPGFRLEPLGPEHNERDHAAWMASIEHIHSTPGYELADWPQAMSLEANNSDLVGHANDFASRSGFTYSILDGDKVIGCLYIYPSDAEGTDARVRSWVVATRAEMDEVVWREVSAWLVDSWPFRSPEYAARR